MMYDDHDDYVTLAQAAQRLNMTENKVLDLAKRGILRSYWDGCLWVQVALIAGVTT